MHGTAHIFSLNYSKNMLELILSGTNKYLIGDFERTLLPTSFARKQK